jgi:hydrogenase expression/formation protein HypD
VRQVNEQRSEVENQYIRAVTPAGNETAQALCAEFFEVREAFEWRGIGALAASALRLREKYARFDAEKRFAVETVPAQDNPACECGAILRGQKKPAECKLFGTVCTPETPTGPCMVSAEGACAAHWTYGRFRERTARRQQEGALDHRLPAA